MVQILLFALVGFSSALVNLGIYNLVLLGLRAVSLFSGFDFLKLPSLYADIGSREIIDFIKTTVTENRCSLSIIDPL